MHLILISFLPFGMKTLQSVYFLGVIQLIQGGGHALARWYDMTQALKLCKKMIYPRIVTHEILEDREHVYEMGDLGDCSMQGRNCGTWDE